MIADPNICSRMNDQCIFCKIINGELAGNIVFADEVSLAFLDNRPLFPGHCLLVPKAHFETLADLPVELVGSFFRNAQLLARAVETALAAEGSFVAMNNRVSQSVPHLHVHIVPRRRKDGLKGFFWPRHKYENPEEIEQVAELIRVAIEKLTPISAASDSSGDSR
jgi:histidine triad (HIT) family protein